MKARKKKKAAAHNPVVGDDTYVTININNLKQSMQPKQHFNIATPSEIKLHVPFQLINCKILSISIFLTNTA